MDKETLTKMEEVLRFLSETEKDFGELCVNGRYYWVVPKIYLQSDIDEAEIEAKKMKDYFDKSR